MPINPNIALGVQPIQTPDLMGQMGQAMTLRSLMDQQKLRDMQVMGLQRQYAREDATRSAGVIGPDGQVDEAATFKNLVGAIGVPGAQEWKNKFTQDRLATDKAKYDAEKSQLEGLKTRWGISAQAFSSILKDPTLENIQAVRQQLRNNGIEFKDEDLPQSPEQILPFLQRQIAMGMAVKDTIDAEEKRLARLMPTSEPGKIDRDMRLRQQTGGNYDLSRPGMPAPAVPGVETKPFNPAPVNAQPMDAQGNPAPASAPAFDPMQQAYLRSVLGNPPEGFQWGPNGQPVPMPEVIRQRMAERRAGATNVKVGVTAFDKELDELSAKTISTARDTAEKAYTTADDMGMIVEALKGWGGGPFKEFAALIGKALPGTEFEKISTASQFAESIRQRLAPTMRVVGSGSTSDMEMRGFLASIPSLSNTETGRLLIARVARKIADRAAAAADIKEEMIRAKTYTVRAFRERMKSEFGDSILDDEDKKMLKLNQPNYNISGMPDPKSSAGKTIEAEDGTRYRSDGNRWVRQ